MIDASRDPCHLDAVEIALLAERIDVERHVGQRVGVVRHVEVADRRVEIDGLDGEPGEGVHRVEHLGEAEEVLATVAVAGPAFTVEVDVVGCAGHRTVRHPVTADAQVAFWRPAVQRELGRG